MTTSKSRIDPGYLVLKNRSIEAWHKLLLEIEDARLRYKVSAIVWWDWIADRTVSDEIYELSASLRESHHYDGIASDILRELTRLGYSKRNAQLRSAIPKGKRDYRKENK